MDDWRGAARSWIRALRQPATYQVWRNPYAAFGLLWGLPVPLVCSAVHLGATGQPLEVVAAARWLVSGPLGLGLALHPLLFLVVFGAVGTGMAERSARIDQLIGTLRSRAETDGLTGLLNHRTFHERADVADEASLLMIDVDHFKRVNDRHGHVTGDALLRALAHRLRSAVRPYDVVCRYGGEEFAVLLPRTPAAEAAEIAERLRRDVGEAPFRLRRDLDVSVTISAGVAARRPGESSQSWIARADERLYASKAAGRNRVTSATPRSH